ATKEANRIAEWNRRETDERKKSRQERGQRVEEPVPKRRYEVFFHKHFDGVSQHLKEAKSAKAQNGGSVGANSILHYCTLLSFHPGQNGCQIKHSNQNN